MVGSPARVAHCADDPCRMPEWSRRSTEFKGQILGAVTRWARPDPPGQWGGRGPCQAPGTSDNRDPSTQVDATEAVPAETSGNQSDHCSQS